MRKIVVLILALSFRMLLWAQPLTVTSDEAARVALRFLTSRQTEAQRAAMPVLQATSVTPLMTGTLVTGWWVNASPSGWVLVSGVRDVRPILAYGFEGDLSTMVLPPATEAWIAQYEQAISARITSGEGSRGVSHPDWDFLLAVDATALPYYGGRSVEPLLYTSWDQGRFYNGYCPPDPSGPGGHCYAGCVPTAMGQIVNYFRWPVTGTGSYSYDDPDYGTLSADFGNTTYRWNEMPPSVNQTNDAVAELLYHLGVSCDLVYGPDGSGMYNHKAAYALRTFFKYDPATTYVFRDSTTMDWDSLIIDHLDRDIPLYYAGWSVPNINGHAFVCDGYQEDHYYHFNWGWSGSYDGYFFTDALNPGGSNFNLAQELIINAVPDETQYPYPQGCEGYTSLSTTAGSIDDGSGPWYPYEPGTDCSWQLAVADSVETVTLSFLSLDLGAGDTLWVYEGEDAGAPLVAAISGNTIPDDLIIGSNALFLHFVASGTNAGQGFLLSYFARIASYCTANEVLTDMNGVVTDGSGPRDYHNTTACMWMIAPPGVQTIELTFTAFDTEAGYDVVTVYDGNEVLGEFSGQELPPSLTAHSGYMFIVFSTNFDITASGWAATWQGDITSVESGALPAAGLQAYPNPATHDLLVRLPASSAAMTCRLMDINGKVVRTTEAVDQVSWQVTDLPSGLYVVRASDGNQQYTTRVLIGGR